MGVGSKSRGFLVEYSARGSFETLGVGSNCRLFLRLYVVLKAPELEIPLHWDDACPLGVHAKWRQAPATAGSLDYLSLQSCRMLCLTSEGLRVAPEEPELKPAPPRKAAQGPRRVR